MNVRNGRLVSLDIVLELCAISLKNQIFNENINFTLSNEFLFCFGQSNRAV